MNRVIIKGASGLGDSVYLFPIVRAIEEKGGDVTVLSFYPDVFASLACEVLPYRLTGFHIDCSYVPFKERQSTTQFEDMLSFFSFEDVPLTMPAPVTQPPDFSENGKKVCVVKQPSVPSMNPLFRELVPKGHTFQRVIDALADEYVFVAVGYKGEIAHPLTGIDYDLTDCTSVRDVLSLVAASDLVLTQPGFLLPMAEAFGTPCFTIFSERGLVSPRRAVATITPAKLVCSPKTGFALDSNENVEKEVCAYVRRHEVVS